nr:MAG TPA: Transcription initiation factor IIE, alpha FINGER, Transcription [Bacteriophage sp.]
MAIQPYNALKAYDADVIDNYIHRAIGSYPSVDTKSILESWNEAKTRLFNEVFDKKLRITTHVTADLKDDLEFARKSIVNASLNIVPSVADYMYNLEYSGLCDDDTVKKVLGLFKASDVLSDKQVDDTEIALFTPLSDGTSKTKLLLRGKRMRVIRKALEFVGYPFMKLFTQFRDRVSLIRTTQRLDADVVLSIHPIDFLSMSDNNSGWTSCMSLVGKGSDRSGVTEYMNSPTAVVAYMESNVPFLPGVPNKSWRMMLFYDLDADVALGSRQYPFFSAELARGALSALTSCESYEVKNYPWIQEDRLLLEQYENFDVRNETQKFKDFETKMLEAGLSGGWHVSPWSYGACNDFFMFHNDDKFFEVNKEPYKLTKPLRLQMSGKPTCLHCGQPLDPERWGTRRVVCEKCSKEVNELNEARYPI